MAERFQGRLGIQQRILPVYRAPLFELLAARAEGGLSVFAGQPGPGEAIASAEGLKVARFEQSRNRHWLSVQHPLYLCRQPGLVAWLESWNPDALIAEANPRYVDTGGAVRWMRTRGRPVIGWGLGAPPPSGPLAGFRNRRRKRFLGQFDALIAYSSRGAQEYQALGFAADKIYVAHNAAAARPARPPPEKGLTFNGQPTVLFVGRLQARKQVGDLLQACAALPEARQPRLLIVGDGPGRGAFEKMAQAVYPQAVFTGALHGEELAPYYRAADLFVLPGTGGLAVQQSMSHGLPVIVAEGDGTQADLVRKENGWLVPPGDHHALRRRLDEALSDPARLRRMGAESYRIVDEEINLESMVARMIQALNALT